MSYVSPPESRSRVENIKKRFEVANVEEPSSHNDNTNFNKNTPNKNASGNKPQSSNGFKNTSSPRKKTMLHTSSSNSIDIPKKPINTSSIKSSPGGPMKTERQLSNPYGRAHVRRSPAFRCDKIVKGRNVTGQNSGVRERNRSVVDNSPKVFEDVQSVKSVVKKLNSTPIPVPGDSSKKSIPISFPNPGETPRPPLRKQCAFDEGEVKVKTAVNSGNVVATSHVTETRSDSNQNKSVYSNKTPLSKRTGAEKSETGSETDTKLSKSEYSLVSKQLPSSFLYKLEQNRVRIPAENKIANVANNSISVRNVELEETNAKATSPSDGIKGILSVANGVEEREHETCKAELTDTLKAALKAPLPPGPPPKKPPRTFAHASPSPRIAPVPSVSNNSAIDTVSNKALLVPQRLKFTKSASEKTNVKTPKPVRSKTESQIMLRKLENVLLNHQQGIGNIVLNPKSPIVKKKAENTTTTHSELESRKPVGRLGPLPSLPSESELHSCESPGNSKFGGCINFGCVSNSNNPMYSQIHFYEKVPQKQSEFFVNVPKNQSKSTIRPYGALLHSKSRSEEHIYAEPFDYMSQVQHNLQNHRGLGTVLKSGESVGDLSKVGASLEELQKQTSTLEPKFNIHQSGGLHYLCTPIHPDGTSAPIENGIKAKNSDPKKLESTVPTLAERRGSSEPQSLVGESGTEERKKPSFLRLAALVRGGQSAGGADIPSKVDRMKVS